MVHLTGEWITAYESNYFLVFVGSTFTIKLSLKFCQEEVNAQKNAEAKVLSIYLQLFN